MKKKRIQQRDINVLQDGFRHIYINKFFNLFMNSIKWTGLTTQERDYVMRQFWSCGTVGAFKIALTDMIGFAPWAAQNYNIYDYPEQLLLINKRGVPFIPSHTLTVNKDVCIGYIQSNKKPIADIVSFYVDRLVEVEMVININLNTNKMPFVIGVSPTDADKANDIISRILNNELIVFADLEELNLVKSFATSTPYIIDRLYQYKTSIENELLTYLGIDNSSIDKKERLLVDEVNANNALINANSKGMIGLLKEWCEDIKNVLGFEITAETNLETVDSVHEEPEAEVLTDD